ncbi:MAG: hypothetical protein RMK64_04905 [Rhodovarius sp.]|nr:hypothetical protein [Rhodovarius sp.]MDW8314290.1 hypothetical protein [Rhodovarius sp.]
MMRPALAALLVLPVLACAPGGPSLPVQTAVLPAEASPGAGDPTRAAILSAAYVLNDRRAMSDPAVAARAAANVEYLAVTLPGNPHFTAGALTQLQFEAAREEVRRTLGIAADAPAQLVVDSLYAAARALSVQDRAGAAAALAPRAFPDREATLARLSAMPALPLSARAAASAEELIRRQDIERSRQMDGGNDRPTI